MKNQEIFRNFTFTDDYVFCSILTENPHICKRIAELATGRKIKEIVKIQAQKSIKKTKDGRGVRFDVVFEDDESNIYDIEMQKLKRGDIPKRARYYQSMLDLDSLGKGKDKTYTKLKNGYIIFICDFDLFGKGDYRYVAKTMVVGHPDCDYDDGSRKVFLNTHYTKEDMDPELKAFLDYLKTGFIASDFVLELEDIKNKLLDDAERRSEFMTLQETYAMYLEEGREEGREKGRKEGREEGRKEGREEGRKEGIEEGELRKVFSLFIKGKLTKADAVEESGLTEAEFDRNLEEYRQTHTA